MTETPKKTGIFGRMFGSTGKQYKQAKLGGKNEAYYDEETKSWRFPSDPAGPQPAATNVPPPPPKPFHQGVLAASSPPPRTLGSNGTGDMAANSLPTIPMMDKPSGGTTVPPHTNPLRLTKVGSSGRLRGRYVDTFNPNLTAEELERPFTPPQPVNSGFTVSPSPPGSSPAPTLMPTTPSTFVPESSANLTPSKMITATQITTAAAAATTITPTLRTTLVSATTTVSTSQYVASREPPHSPNLPSSPSPDTRADGPPPAFFVPGTTAGDRGGGQVQGDPEQDNGSEPMMGTSTVMSGDQNGDEPALENKGEDEDEDDDFETILSAVARLTPSKGPVILPQHAAIPPFAANGYPAMPSAGAAADYAGTTFYPSNDQNNKHESAMAEGLKEATHLAENASMKATLEQTDLHPRHASSEQGEAPSHLAPQAGAEADQQHMYHENFTGEGVQQDGIGYGSNGQGSDPYGSQPQYGSYPQAGTEAVEDSQQYGYARQYAQQDHDVLYDQTISQDSGQQYQQFPSEEQIPDQQPSYQVEGEQPYEPNHNGNSLLAENGGLGGQDVVNATGRSDVQYDDADETSKIAAAMGATDPVAGPEEVQQGDIYPQDAESLAQRCRQLEEYNLLWQQRADAVETELQYANDTVKSMEVRAEEQLSRIQQLEEQLSNMQQMLETEKAGHAKDVDEKCEKVRQEAEADNEEQMADLLVCLGQETDKVERLTAELEKLGVDVDVLLEGIEKFDVEPTPMEGDA